jgi:fused signal recognition particle receptor
MKKDWVAGLTKTRQSFFGRIAGLFQDAQLTDETWDELEALLLQADVGTKTTIALVEALRAEVQRSGTRSATQAQELLKKQMVAILQKGQRPYLAGIRQLHVVLVVGVNGSGKTTSIAKLTKYHQQERRDKVLLAAADTFRAAAIDQLKVWGDRLKVEVVAHQPGADPGAVVYDAIRAAPARGANVLIIDTAGRLHTKQNLMQELVKITGVAQKQVHQAPHETLLVLDATTGQNALAQARTFAQMVGVTGVVLAKLDSTAKGGMVLAIAGELGLPVLFAATGEAVDDFAPFDATAFVEALFTEKKN